MTHTNNNHVYGIDTSSPVSTVSYPYEADSVATLFRASSGNTLHGFPEDYPWTQVADTMSLESGTEHDVWSDLDESVSTSTNFMSTDCDSILFPYDDAVLCCGKQECQCDTSGANVPAMDDDDLMNEDWVRILSDDQVHFCRMIIFCYVIFSLRLCTAPLYSIYPNWTAARFAIKGGFSADCTYPVER